jgi:hypothetical protein
VENKAWKTKKKKFGRLRLALRKLFSIAQAAHIQAHHQNCSIQSILVVVMQQFVEIVVPSCCEAEHATALPLQQQQQQQQRSLPLDLFLLWLSYLPAYPSLISLRRVNR